jgi:hypothetical protein
MEEWLKVIEQRLELITGLDRERMHRTRNRLNDLTIPLGILFDLEDVLV